MRQLNKKIGREACRFFMKKLLLLIQFLLMPAIISYAEIFTLTTAAGINSFTQKEYVFQNDSKVSELTWDCPIIPYIEGIH